MAISNVVIRTKILVDGRKRRRDESWIERTFPPLRASETIVLVFLAVLTIVITTSDLHFSRGITFPAGECKFERRAGSGREGLAEFKKKTTCIAGNGYNLCGIAYHYRFNDPPSTICLNDVWGSIISIFMRSSVGSNTFRVRYYFPRFLNV